MIELENIEFSYRKKMVLNQLSMEIVPGDFVAIAGSNGCGKSTLLAILSGALKPDYGSIRYYHQDALNDHRLFSKYIGYVPQENPLIPELSVKDNLKLWFQGTKMEFNEELNHGFLHLLDIESYLNTPIRKLSGGMKKRVSIGCALSNHPPILVMDEPSAALDLLCKNDIHNYLSMYLKNGGTVIVTTHEESELDLCNKLFVLKDGKLTQISSSLRGKQLLNFF
ncbi:MAG TPA: ABC transporter ATP-binding protein [Lachnospiraceae bacterium]|nr:ABC transporter ATP-binding protein [Lachnospiraceae bacterium]